MVATPYCMEEGEPKSPSYVSYGIKYEHDNTSLWSMKAGLRGSETSVLGSQYLL